MRSRSAGSFPGRLAPLDHTEEAAGLTRPPLAHPVMALQMHDSFRLGSERHHFLLRQPL